LPQKKLSIRIDGALVDALEGQTILQAARAGGKYIPTLCDLEGITPVGGCRICMVEIEGNDRVLAACTSPVQEGMSVKTTTPRLTQHRRLTVELLLVERNHICAVCVANNHCELQDLAEDLAIDHFELPVINPKVGIDASHPLFAIDHNRCIMCVRHAPASSSPTACWRLVLRSSSG